jgi:hypothetical protein
MFHIKLIPNQGVPAHVSWLFLLLVVISMLTPILDRAVHAYPKSRVHDHQQPRSLPPRTITAIQPTSSGGSFQLKATRQTKSAQSL